MIFSFYSRREEKVIWFPGESRGLGQQPLCWREVKKVPAKLARRNFVPFLGVLTRLEKSG